MKDTLDTDLTTHLCAESHVFFDKKINKSDKTHPYSKLSIWIFLGKDNKLTPFLMWHGAMMGIRIQQCGEGAELMKNSM